jgi:hypothetical protein
MLKLSILFPDRLRMHHQPDTSKEDRVLAAKDSMIYQYHDITQMQKVAEGLSVNVQIGDFYRTGIEIYVGGFPDVSGPDLVIDPTDHKGVELFKEFAAKLADHYKTVTT